MDTKFIEQLFYKQVRALTIRTCEAYDYQFSGDWALNMHAGGQKIW